MNIIKKIVVYLCICLIAQSTAISNNIRGRIAVIDTGTTASQMDRNYMCQNTEQEIGNGHPHGRNVMGLIGSRINSKRFCVVSIDLGRGYARALKKLLKSPQLVAVNLSLSGQGFDQLEYDILNELLENGVTIVVAAGNKKTELNRNFCNTFPACLKLRFMDNPNFIVVGSNTGSYSNWSNEIPIELVDGTKKGSPELTGSSQSSAILTGRLFRD
jgi:hypothetical protein